MGYKININGYSINNTDYTTSINGYKITFTVDGNTLHTITVKKDMFCTNEEIEELTLPEEAKIEKITMLNFYSDVDYPFIKNFIISESVTCIEKYAFENSQIFKVVTWPKNCKIIPNGCFYHSSIEHIYGIENVTCINERAFALSNLRSINYPKSCVSISSNCFKQSKLKEITGIDNIVEIAPGAFEGSRIESFIWPSKAEVIPERCFSDCKALKTISWLKDISLIGEYSFCRCINLKEIKVSSKHISLSMTAFNGIRDINIDLSQCYIDMIFGDFPANKAIVQNWIKSCKYKGIILPYYLDL